MALGNEEFIHLLIIASSSPSRHNQKQPSKQAKDKAPCGVNRRSLCRMHAPVCPFHPAHAALLALPPGASSFSWQQLAALIKTQAIA